jgi:hypothetical protein
MAITSSFDFHNTTASSTSLSLVALGPNSGNYAMKGDDSATMVTYSNNTTDRPNSEICTRKSRTVPRIDTSANIMYPGPVPGGVIFSNELCNVYMVRSSDDPNFRIDLPIVTSVQVRVPLSEYITDSVLTECLSRNVSGFLDASGNWIFTRLMRGSVRLY